MVRTHIYTERWGSQNQAKTPSVGKKLLAILEVKKGQEHRQKALKCRSCELVAGYKTANSDVLNLPQLVPHSSIVNKPETRITNMAFVIVASYIQDFCVSIVIYSYEMSLQYLKT